MAEPASHITTQYLQQFQGKLGALRNQLEGIDTNRDYALSGDEMAAAMLPEIRAWYRDHYAALATHGTSFNPEAQIRADLEAVAADWNEHGTRQPPEGSPAGEAYERLNASRSAARNVLVGKMRDLTSDAVSINRAWGEAVARQEQLRNDERAARRDRATVFAELASVFPPEAGMTPNEIAAMADKYKGDAERAMRATLKRVAEAMPPPAAPAQTTNYAEQPEANPRAAGLNNSIADWKARLDRINHGEDVSAALKGANLYGAERASKSADRPGPYFALLQASGAPVPDNNHVQDPAALRAAVIAEISDKIANKQKELAGFGAIKSAPVATTEPPAPSPAQIIAETPIGAPLDQPNSALVNPNNQEMLAAIKGLQQAAVQFDPDNVKAASFCGLAAGVGVAQNKDALCGKPTAAR